MALHKEGIPYGDISKKMNVSKGCISQTLKRYRETGGYGNRKRSGGPSGTSARDDNAIHGLVKQTAFITSPEIKQELPFLRITPRTIRHRLLTKFNLRSCKPAMQSR